MMKQLYLSAWLLLGTAAILAGVTGFFNSLTLFIFSCIALGLVYGFALWSVIVNTREPQRQ